MKKSILTLLVVLFAATAFAGPGAEPGSILVFPLFDSRPGAETILTVTNTNFSRGECSDWLHGDVVLHYQYFDGQAWLEFDRYEVLGPGDTLSVIASQHNPESEFGNLFVSAENPLDHTDPLISIEFNHLIGSAMIIDSLSNGGWSYVPYAFQGPEASLDPCNRFPTDSDGDGTPDFDGIEYQKFPREVFIDSFFEERGRFVNRVTLMTTTRPDFRNEIETLVWNNKEQFSIVAGQMQPWYESPLSTLHPVASDLQGDPNELGRPPLQTGWALIRGTRIVDLAGNPVLDRQGNPAIPPILGVFMQSVTGRDFTVGGAMPGQGELDGLELNVGDGDPQDNS